VDFLGIGSISVSLSPKPGVYHLAIGLIELQLDRLNLASFGITG
jgi:hypothetical protein